MVIREDEQKESGNTPIISILSFHCHLHRELSLLKISEVHPQSPAPKVTGVHEYTDSVAGVDPALNTVTMVPLHNGTNPEEIALIYVEVYAIPFAKTLRD